MATSNSSGNRSLWVDDEYELLTETREWMSVPEKRLLFAILERAVRDCLGSRSEDSEEASEWIFFEEDDPEEAPFSFRWICESLEIDRNEFRDRILKRGRPGLDTDVTTERSSTPGSSHPARPPAEKCCCAA